MRNTVIALAALAMAAPLAAQQQQAKEKDPTNAVEAVPLPTGWSMRLDDKDATKSAKFITMGPGFHVTSGGAAIYWRAADAQKDDYTVSASFHQTKKIVGHGDHGEAYGVFAAGRDLSDASKESYLYLEVRQDGSYYVAHRAGNEVHKLVEWTPNAAVKKIDDAPNASNELAIKVAADSVRFVINGTQVNALPRGAMLGDMSGQAGVRVNHNLDVHVGTFSVKSGGK